MQVAYAGSLCGGRSLLQPGGLSVLCGPPLILL